MTGIKTLISTKQTLAEREKQLQTLLATPAGKAELLDLASRYAAGDGAARSEKASIITYLLVYERTHGLIV